MLAPLTDADPRTVGRYRLQGRLGVGGMGAVYLGFDTDGRPSAVKVIRPDLAGDAEFRDRFRREFAAACRVRSEFVAQVRDADVDADMPWMATEYVEGVSLSSAVARRVRLDGAMLMGLAAGLADSLVAIHAAGLVHRDLKPSNILLAWDGPKVIDFGIARALDATSHTSTGDVLGTVAWMAPEQLRGERASPAADVFAWAMCTVFAARGRHAFPAETPAASAIRILQDAPDLEGVPEGLIPLLTQALDKDPARRPSAVEVVSSLVGAQVSGLTGVAEASRRLIDNGWTAPTALPLPPAPPVPTPADPTPADEVVPPTRRRSSRSNRFRRRGAVLGPGLAVVITVAALAAALTRPGDGGRGDATLNPDPARQHSALGGNPGGGSPPGGAGPSGTPVPPSPTATATPSAPAPGPPSQTAVPVAASPASTDQPPPAAAAPPPRPATTALLRYYSGTDHASLTRAAPAGYHLEGSIGTIYTTAEVPGTHPLFECWIGANSFTSAAANCEGQQVAGHLGWVYGAPQSNPATVPIVRCRLGDEHFDSNDPGCEGQHVEGVLGYAVAG